jgi:hypothetical protein
MNHTKEATPMSDTKIVEKIMKLLALAGNNPSDAEATAAMLKAQKLMAEHNISTDEVTMKDASKEKDQVAVKWVMGAARTAWARTLADILCRNFRTRFLLSTGTASFCFVGMPDDVQITISLFNYAMAIMEKGMKKARRDYRKQGRNTDGVAGDYSSGFLKGLKDRFAEQVNKEGWGLVIVAPEAVITVTTEMTHGTAKEAKMQPRRGDAEIYRRGYEDGKNLSQQKQIKN